MTGSWGKFKDRHQQEWAQEIDRNISNVFKIFSEPKTILQYSGDPSVVLNKDWKSIDLPVPNTAQMVLLNCQLEAKYYLNDGRGRTFKIILRFKSPLMTRDFIWGGEECKNGTGATRYFWIKNEFDGYLLISSPQIQYKLLQRYRKTLDYTWLEEDDESGFTDIEYTIRLLGYI